MSIDLIVEKQTPRLYNFFNDQHSYLLAENFHAQLCLTIKNLHLLEIIDLLPGQISCSAELSMKKKKIIIITSGSGFM